MNLLQHWIKEIHSELDLDDGTVKVEVTVNCWGAKSRKERVFNKEAWEQIKQAGVWEE